MSDSIASLAVVADSTYGHGQHPNAGSADKHESEQNSSETPNPADLRLIIEDGGEDGALIYKIVDGRTGRVVQTLDRDQVLKMREARNYVAGQVITTRA